MRTIRLSLPSRNDPWRQVRARWQRFLEGLLARDENGPRFRTQAVAAFFILLWGGAALVERPVPSPELLNSLLAGQPALAAALLRPIVTAVLAVFSLETLRHLVLPGIIIFLGLRDGARYLDDLFELKDFTAAQNYLMLSLFGGAYPVMAIKDGEVTSDSKRTTVFRIGGPGYVKIHLGNAALFERVDGAADVVAATRGHFLHGFETLREVVDLRDQIRQRTDMEVYTKDGLLVKAVDVQAIFRVWSGGQPRSQQLPYPFEEPALRRVVYGRAVAAGGLAPAWAEAVAEKASGVVTRYIGSHLLKQLIAQKEKQGITSAAEREAVTAGRAIGSKPVLPEALPANTRQRLSLSMYSEATAQEFEDAGVELIWIGVGTLDTPDEVEQELIDAWQADLSARLKSGRYNLDDDRRKARGQVLEKFIGEIAEWWRRFAPSLSVSLLRPSALSGDAGEAARSLFRETPSDEVKLLSLFHLKLSELREALNGREALPADVEAALAHVAAAARIILGEDDDSGDEPEPEAGLAAPLAELVFEKLDPGDRFVWLDQAVRVTQIIHAGTAAGVVLERADGQPFPPQDGLPASHQHFLARTDFEAMLRAGDLAALPAEPTAPPPAAEPLPVLDAETVGEGQIFYWRAAHGLVRVVEVVREGARGVYVERPNGRDFPTQADLPRGPRRFISLQDLQGQLASGELRPEKP